MKQLRLSAELSLPLDAVTKKFGFFGQNGTGKTYAAMKLAELMLDSGAQVVAIDPVGKWYGLRLAANGKDPSGIEIHVFGGLHGDIPLEATAGALMADVIVDRGISAVLDVSQFEYDAERARFVEAFARRLFHRKKASPSAIHLIIEEAQEFLPIAPQRGEEKMLHEVLRIGKIGRNHGFGWTLITPRPQEITTKARNLSDVVFAFRLNGVHERKAIAEWVKEKGADLDVVDLLPKLKSGTAHAWSPSWSEFSGTVHIEKKRTFDASATPQVGVKAVEPKPLGSIDLEQLRVTMAASIEKAKAEDPKELHKKIAQLTKELAKKGVEAPDPAVVEQRVRFGIAEGLKDEWKRVRRAVVVLEKLRGAIADISGATLNTVHDRIVVAQRMRGEVVELLQREETLPTPATAKAQPVRHASRVATPDRAVIPSGARVSHRAKGESNGALSAGEQRVVDALAELKAMGVETPTRPQAGAMARYDLTGGSGSGYVASLVAAGYVELPGSGKLQLTAAGEAIAAPPPEFISDEELHNRALSYLKAGEAKILRRLLELYPEPTSRAALGTDVGYDLSGKSGTVVAHHVDTIAIVVRLDPQKPLRPFRRDWTKFDRVHNVGIRRRDGDVIMDYQEVAAIKPIARKRKSRGA